MVLGPLDAVSYASDFSSDSDGWNFTRVALDAPHSDSSISSIASNTTDSAFMRVALTATAGQHFIYRTVFYDGYGRKATGGIYKIKFKYYITSASPNLDSILINQGPTITVPDALTNRLSNKNEWTEVEITLAGNSTQYLFFYALNAAGSIEFTGSTSDKFYVKDFENYLW